MSYLSRIQKAKRILADIKKPTNSFELKYQNLNADEAWDLFFKLFIIRFKHATKIIADTTPIQWKTLSDIYNFLDDKVIRLSQTVSEFNDLIKKFGTSEYKKAFENHFSEIEAITTKMRTESQQYKQLAFKYQITQHSLYKKYEPYLQELLTLTPEILFDNYFLQGKMPLETFDENCVDQEGDPITNLQKE